MNDVYFFEVCILAISIPKMSSDEGLVPPTQPHHFQRTQGGNKGGKTKWTADGFKSSSVSVSKSTSKYQLLVNISSSRSFFSPTWVYTLIEVVNKKGFGKVRVNDWWCSNYSWVMARCLWTAFWKTYLWFSAQKLQVFNIAHIGFGLRIINRLGTSVIFKLRTVDLKHFTCLRWKDYTAFFYCLYYSGFLFLQIRTRFNILTEFVHLVSISKLTSWWKKKMNSWLLAQSHDLCQLPSLYGSQHKQEQTFVICMLEMCAKNTLHKLLLHILLGESLYL